MKKTKGLRVGVFDSGIGGLTVLRSCVRLLPEVSFCYLGDNANAPYGNRSEEEITAFTKRAIDFFAEDGVDAVVIACNTATAVCIDEMRKHYPFPIVGVEPALKAASKSCKNVLVLATVRTAQSDRVKRLAGDIPDCSFTLCGLSDLARAIERKLLYGEEFSFADHLPQGNGGFDGVVLGCTHYSFFREQISTFYHLPVFDGNFGTAKRLASVLYPEKAMDFGIADHAHFEGFPEHLYGNTLNNYKTQVKFIGKFADLNQKIFFSNICFSFS